jgi:hypothetical protein
MPHPNSAIAQLCSYENLFWAWQKIRSYYSATETWYDEHEFRDFELRLRESLMGEQPTKASAPTEDGGGRTDCYPSSLLGERA